MYEQIPLAVLEQYEGKWIVWDEDERRVVGCGDTVEEAEQQAQNAPMGHLLRIHHVLGSSTEIAGML